MLCPRPTLPMLPTLYDALRSGLGKVGSGQYVGGGGEIEALLKR